MASDEVVERSCASTRTEPAREVTPDAVPETVAGVGRGSTEGGAVSTVELPLSADERDR